MSANPRESCGSQYDRVVRFHPQYECCQENFARALWQAWWRSTQQKGADR